MRIDRRRTWRRGMGLIELLISVAILAVVLVGVARALTGTQRLRSELDGQAQARSMLGALEEDLLDGISAYALNETLPSRTLTGQQLLAFVASDGQGYVDPALYHATLTLLGTVDISGGERTHLQGRYALKVCYQGEADETCLDRALTAPVPREINGGGRVLSSAGQRLSLTIASTAPLAPDVEVRGVSTQRYDTLGTHTYTQSVTGTLQVQARAVNDAQYSYAPSISDQGVVAQRSRLFVQYRAVTGAVNVSYAQAGSAVRLSQGGRVVKTFSADGVAPRLAPGVYTLEGDPLSVGGVLRAAVIEPSVLQVREGQTASARVTYPNPSGSVEVTVQNATPLTPEVTLTQEEYTVTVNGSRVLSGLREGLYSVTAKPLVYGGYTYLPDVSPAVVDVPSAGQGRVNVRYVKQSVRVRVERTEPALPYRAGNGSLEAGAVVVPVTGSGLEAEFPPGSFRVTAPNATARLRPDQRAEIEPSSFVLRAGESRTVQIMYRAARATLILEVIDLYGNPELDVTFEVTEPSGNVRLVRGAARLDNLQPGRYGIVAIDDETGMEGIGPTNVTLAAGQSVTARYVFR